MRRVALLILFMMASLAVTGCSRGPHTLPCASHDECPSGQFCDPDTGLCVDPDPTDPCRYCHSDEYCLQGDCLPCRPACKSDTDCLTFYGQTCDTSNGRCEGPLPPFCAVDGDTPDGDSADGDTDLPVDGDTRPDGDSDPDLPVDGDTAPDGDADRPPVCLTDDDCPRGTLCWDDGSGPDCLPMCDPLGDPCEGSRLCHPLLDGERECGGVCLSEAGGARSGQPCDPEDPLAEPCRADLTCLDGRCRALCDPEASDPGCRDGFLCTPAFEACPAYGACVPGECATDDDCAVGARCVLGRCVAVVGCRADGECRSGEICYCDGTCIAGCEKTGCPPAEGACNLDTHRCETCAIPCEAGETCNLTGRGYECGRPCSPTCCDGQVCQRGTCVNRPAADGDQDTDFDPDTDQESDGADQEFDFDFDWLDGDSDNEGDSDSVWPDGDNDGTPVDGDSPDTDRPPGPVPPAGPSCLPPGGTCLPDGQPCCERGACLAGRCVLI